MTGPVFATRWDFLFGQVVIGVDVTTGAFSGSQPTPGQQMVAVWSSVEIAEQAMHVESWELRPILVRDLLTLVPAGIGVQVDPERTSGMTAPAAYVAALKQFVEPFPADAAVRVTTWDDLPAGAVAAVAQAAQRHGVSRVSAFVYTVDDSPPIGCLAWVAETSTDPSAVGQPLETALLAASSPEMLGVVTVRAVPVGEVPPEVWSVVGGLYLVGGRSRRAPRFWRR